jgi:hypothetical protein
MNLFCLCLCAAFIATTSVAQVDPDHDTTPAPICGRMPDVAIIKAISSADAQIVCRAMRVLDGVRVKDIRNFSKAALVLNQKVIKEAMTRLQNSLSKSCGCAASTTNRIDGMQMSI